MPPPYPYPYHYPYSYPYSYPQPQTIQPSSLSRNRAPDPPSRELYIQSQTRAPSSAQGPQTPPPQRQTRGTTPQRPHPGSHQAHSPRGSDARPPKSHSNSHRAGAGAGSLPDSKPGPSDQTQTPSLQALRTRDILRNPRLQQITGVRPGRLNLAGVAELPPEELRRLAWAMSLPEPFPFKRPRGDRGFSSPW
ncbi:hypothetical protein F5B18DRAFT_154022 [Nemania serpens]|nr:hypothetical protein F5B18DRAFT_154022 [Nemania serpens]